VPEQHEYSSANSAGLHGFMIKALFVLGTFLIQPHPGVRVVCVLLNINTSLLVHCLQGSLSEDAVQYDIWDAGSRCIVNEPLFVPRPGATAEDEGWVLVTVHDAEADQGKLVILDAQCLADGPVATIHLQHFLPAGLHGSFAADVFTHNGVNHAFSAVPEWREPNVVRAL